MIATDPTPVKQSAIIPDSLPALHRAIMLCVAALGVSAALFVLVPGIDLAVSGWFYMPGRGFPRDKTLVYEVVRKLGIGITVATMVGLIGLGVRWVLQRQTQKRWPSPTAWADWLFMTGVLAIGPGLLVNLIIKPIWGRARPRHVTQFGGSALFSPAWVVSDQCKWGCSFVSGEAAATCAVLAFCFVVPQRWRVATLLIGCLLTLAISLARIAVGGHFLSDVVTAWLVTLLVMFVLRAQIYHGALLGPVARWLPNRR